MAARWSGTDFPLNSIPSKELQQVILKNREALAAVDDWLPRQLMEHSVFNYGINPDVAPLLNLPLDRECTHTDVLAGYGVMMKGRCKYLEIGVSVGKTLWQILNTCAPCECWAFDIEEINPVLKQRLTEVSRTEWQGPPGSLKKTPSSISRFVHPATNGHLVYICADVFDQRAWETLAGNKFNLVLSDALHTPQAIDFEWTQMTAARIFNPHEIVLLWDDLDGEMKDWFNGKRETIAKELSVGIHNVRTGFVNGWLGRREFPHRFGFAVKWPSTGGAL